MHLAAQLRRLALMLAGLIVLSACTVVVDEPRPVRPGPPGPSFCSREFRPVCAGRFGEQRTFTNSCLADRSRLADHPPRRMPQRGGGGDRPRVLHDGLTSRSRRAPRRRLPHLQQRLRADAAGWRVVRRGEC